MTKDRNVFALCPCSPGLGRLLGLRRALSYQVEMKVCVMGSPHTGAVQPWALPWDKQPSLRLQKQALNLYKYVSSTTSELMSIFLTQRGFRKELN